MEENTTRQKEKIYCLSFMVSREVYEIYHRKLRDEKNAIKSEVIAIVNKSNGVIEIGDSNSNQ